MTPPPVNSPPPLMNHQPEELSPFYPPPNLTSEPAPTSTVSPGEDGTHSIHTPPPLQNQQPPNVTAEQVTITLKRLKVKASGPDVLYQGLAKLQQSARCLFTGAQTPASRHQSAKRQRHTSGRLAQAAVSRHHRKPTEDPGRRAVSSASSPADSSNWRFPLRQLHHSSSAQVVRRNISTSGRKEPRRTPARARHGAATVSAAIKSHSPSVHPRSAVPHSCVEEQQEQLHQHHPSSASEPHRSSRRGQMGRPRHRTCDSSHHSPHTPGACGS
ncbi:uncharacterized protein LOC134438680 [Engraulis encrasicolus]|uniref:uncharacterized protein LOC134438680 n=1 Tax=Engraulis encrasicolus TaxID=184585 RepID=UPI002FD1E6E6